MQKASLLVPCDGMYAIVDIETTGGSSQGDRITEIAIYKHDGERIVDEYITLINPGRRIPYYISELTGIYDNMVQGAPKFFEVARKIVEFTEGCTFVAHNVKFDYHFVRNAFKDLGYNYNRKTLCTVQLSRKLLPGHRSYSLGKLCKELGIELTSHHRAAADARATVTLFEMLLKADGNHFKKTTKKEQKDAEKLGDHPLRKQVLALPETPGVYYLYNDSGELIYVGKSKNLKSRVLSHLANYTTKKALAMRDAVADLRYVETGSDLVAQLKESNEIKKHKPLFNRAQRRSSYSYGLFSEYQLDGYIHLRLGHVKGAEPITTFTTREEGKSYVERLMTDMNLCQRLVGLYGSHGACFHYTIKQCNGACVGQEDAEVYNKRVLQAINNIRYDHDSFIVVDKGRNDDERSVVYVKNFTYQGFGFVPAKLANDPGAMVDAIQPHIDNRDVQQILRGYLQRNEVEKIIPLHNTTETHEPAQTPQ